jgi:hypothetical protein
MPRRCVIMQPTYLPWAGYFHLATQCDSFVFLDDVQLEKQSWQTRNRILVAGKEFLLSVPTSRSHLLTNINQIVVSDWNKWCPKHLRTIDLAYPSLGRDYEFLDLLRRSLYSSRMLSEININIIKVLFDVFAIRCDTFLSSELGCEGRRSEKLANIVKAIGASEYLSPQGSRNYLEADRFSEKFGIELFFQDYNPTAYIQRHSKKFVSHLSIIDVIGNHGPAFASRYVRGLT